MFATPWGKNDAGLELLRQSSEAVGVWSQAHADAHANACNHLKGEIEISGARRSLQTISNCGI